ncbi:MAG: SGNH/GDSL hydrolase family protein [Rhodospirillaceae bacterium]|nr:SGNH/GDSL hydrolase family protein [Rhodospirillaceae bacterium]
MRSFFASSVLTLCSFVVAIGLFEVACRTIVDTGMHYHLEMWKYAVSLKQVAEEPMIGHKHKASKEALLMGANVKLNDRGLRDPDRSNLSGDTTKVLMLGDSVTFGWGVPQSETVSARLETMLSRDADQSFAVINSGVGNYNTAMEVAWFERYGLDYEPDAVVLNVFINDAEPTPNYSDVRWWDKTFYSRVVLFGALDTARRLTLGGVDWKAYYKGLYEDGEPGWHAMQESIERLAALCRTNDIPLIIVDYPELRELSPYPFSDVSKKIANVADKQQLTYISLLSAVDMAMPEALWVTAPDPHPNSFAHQLFAEYLAPRLLGAMSSSNGSLVRDIDKKSTVAP